MSGRSLSPEQFVKYALIFYGSMAFISIAWLTLDEGLGIDAVFVVAPFDILAIHLGKYHHSSRDSMHIHPLLHIHNTFLPSQDDQDQPRESTECIRRSTRADPKYK